MDIRPRTVKQELALLRSEFRIMCTGDSWGDTMHWMFTIADELHRREGMTPEHWQYRPSPLGPTNDPDDYATQLCIEVGADTLEQFGNILHRYCENMRRRGMDY